MRLVFRITPPRNVQPPAPQPLIYSPDFKTPTALLTRLSFGGNMLDRVKPSGEPCGSCGGR
jgi:hypothetical protein